MKSSTNKKRERDDYHEMVNGETENDQPPTKKNKK